MRQEAGRGPLPDGRLKDDVGEAAAAKLRTRTGEGGKPGCCCKEGGVSC